LGSGPVSDFRVYQLLITVVAQFTAALLGRYVPDEADVLLLMEWEWRLGKGCVFR
jgi:hypothetical protein